MRPILMALGPAVAAFWALAAGLASAEEAARYPPAEREVYVAPHGTPEAKGTKESPVDFETAFTDGRITRPGTLVWVTGGRYEVGLLKQGKEVRGTPDKPVVFRAVPGQRATVVGSLWILCDHTWLWGLEITWPGGSGSGVEVRGGDGIHLVNNVIHDIGPTAEPAEPKYRVQGISGWNVGDGHAYYGNIIYHAEWSHGIYTQNTADHSVKRIEDNIIFENAGCGIHAYGESLPLSGFHLEGNACFATSVIPDHAARYSCGQMNILLGGKKPISNLLVKENYTWHPQPDAKRSVDIGYTANGNADIRVIGNCFTGGARALELKGVRQAVVRENVLWATREPVRVTYAPGALRPDVVFRNNWFIDNNRFDLPAWREQTGAGPSNRLVPGRDGRPGGVKAFVRVNRYNRRRVHIIAYNWDHRPAIPVDLGDALARGDAFRVVNVVDYFGKPVLEGEARGPRIVLPMRGHRHEPEFGVYVLTIESPDDAAR